MDNELVHIVNADICIKEYKGQRVVTFKDIDTVHQRQAGTATKGFLITRKDLLRVKIFSL